MVAQPRIAGGTLTPAGNADYTLAPEVVPLSASTIPAASGTSGLWWKFIPSQTGAVNFDAMLSMSPDGTRLWYFPSTAIQVFRDDGTLTLLADLSSGVDPQQGFVFRGSATIEVTLGETYYAYIPAGSDFLRILRVSDYSETTDWYPLGDVTTVLRPDVGSTGPGSVTIEPDEVMRRHHTSPNIIVTTTATAFRNRLGWAGSAAMDHYPQLITDPGYEQWPGLFTTTWESIFNAAKLGPAGEAFDFGPDAGEYHYASPNYAEQSFVDVPIGLHAHSTAPDATPPDRHQTISEEMYAQHFLYNLTRMVEGTASSFDGPMYPQVREDAPLPVPNPGSLAVEWRDPLPTPVQVELHPARRTAAPYVSATYAAFRWRVGIRPLEFEGTRDPDTGHWRIGADLDITTEEFATGLTFRGYDIVDDQIETPPDDAVEDILHVYGDALPAVRGTEVAVIDAGDDDWAVITDATDTAAVLARERETQYPGGPEYEDDRFFSAVHELGGLHIAGIPKYLTDEGYVPPNLGCPDPGAADFDLEELNVLQYPALRVTWQRPDYRYLFPPVVPPVGLGVIPPRRIFQRSDGATHGARRVGAGNTRQSGSRTLGAIL